ncbi:MAG: hypothetical protein K9J74_07610 [Sulfuritalea sp.]|nr:hypothetical protein [Sulfuritalea sp.]
MNRFPPKTIEPGERTLDRGAREDSSRRLPGLPILVIATGLGLVLGQVPARADDAHSLAPPAAAIHSASRPFAHGHPKEALAADLLDMSVRWRQIQTTAQPARLMELCEKFEHDFPGSGLARKIADMLEHGRRTLEIQRNVGFSSEGFDDMAGDSDYRKNLIGAVHGDKEAAYRIAMAYREGQSGLAVNPRRMEQWLRFSAELGSGRASWTLAENFNNTGFVADAARYEKLAQTLGYRPPLRLPSRGY